MKVFKTVPTSESEGFMPVVVVLENESEAKRMWLLFNFASYVYQEARRYDSELTIADYRRDHHNQYDIYNAIYRHPSA